LTVILAVGLATVDDVGATDCDGAVGSNGDEDGDCDSIVEGASDRFSPWDGVTLAIDDVGEAHAVSDDVNSKSARNEAAGRRVIPTTFHCQRGSGRPA
jgi:hypothetical protein